MIQIIKIRHAKDGRVVERKVVGLAESSDQDFDDGARTLFEMARERMSKGGAPIDTGKDQRRGDPVAG